MKKVTSFEIVSHGIDHAQYITGISTYGTSYERTVLGAGNDEKEAFLDAVNLIASEYDTSIIPDNPKGINKKNKVPAKFMKHEDNEMHFYVSILYNVEEDSLS